MAPNFNFISEKMTESDKELFFGPIEKNDKFIVFPENWTMADIVHAAGIFPSRTQARKNGWDKPIPLGFQDMFLTKRKIRVTILNDF
jgi:hypothetical protein